MSETLDITTEQINDLPLLLGIVEDMGIRRMIDARIQLSLAPHTRWWRGPTVGPPRRWRGPIVVPSWDQHAVFMGPRVVPGPWLWSHVSHRKSGVWSHPLPWGRSHPWS